jgi:hypothetical protein
MFLRSKLPCLGWRSADFFTRFFAKNVCCTSANMLVVVLRFLWDVVAVSEKIGNRKVDVSVTNVGRSCNNYQSKSYIIPFFTLRNLPNSERRCRLHKFVVITFSGSVKVIGMWIVSNWIDSQSKFYCIIPAYLLRRGQFLRIRFSTTARFLATFFHGKCYVCMYVLI